jgi:hypothetical protein
VCLGGRGGTEQQSVQHHMFSAAKREQNKYSMKLRLSSHISPCSRNVCSPSGWADRPGLPHPVGFLTALHPRAAGATHADPSAHGVADFQSTSNIDGEGILQKCLRTHTPARNAILQLHTSPRIASIHFGTIQSRQMNHLCESRRSLTPGRSRSRGRGGMQGQGARKIAHERKKQAHMHKPRDWLMNRHIRKQ